MKILVAATALVLAGSLMAVAPARQAQAQTSSKEQTSKKIKKAKPATTRKVVRYRSPYSTNPVHDVYLNGVYVGSDPDPRVRWTIKREACQDQVDGCMDAALR